MSSRNDCYNHYSPSVLNSIASNSSAQKFITMHALSLLALAGTALAVPLSQSESVWFNNCEIVLDHDIDTSVVGIQFTLRPAGVVCAASNFILPSPAFNCGGSGYSFSISKTDGYYSRYTIRISHATESG